MDKETKLDNLLIFAGRSNYDLTNSIWNYFDSSKIIGIHKSIDFPDGEIIVKANSDVRGKDCFIIQSISDPVNDNLMELLIFIDCLKRASAKSITAVIPYFGYARQDRKTEGRTPITAKLVANLLSAAKVDRILTVDLHSMQIEGFFDIPVDHLRAIPVFINYLKTMDLKNIAILSPDVGNSKVASIYASLLDCPLAIINKKRIDGNKVKIEGLIGDVKNKNVLMFDDIISTAGTICSAANYASEKGAITVKVIATHGIFTKNAYNNIYNSSINQIFVTDSLSIKKDIIDRLPIKIISIANLLGEAIYRIHTNRSVSSLLNENYE